MESTRPPSGLPVLIPAGQLHFRPLITEAAPLMPRPPSSSGLKFEHLVPIPAVRMLTANKTKLALAFIFVSCQPYKNQMADCIGVLWLHSHDRPTTPHTSVEKGPGWPAPQPLSYLPKSRPSSRGGQSAAGWVTHRRHCWEQGAQHNKAPPGLCRGGDTQLSTSPSSTLSAGPLRAVLTLAEMPLTRGTATDVFRDP